MNLLVAMYLGAALIVALLAAAGRARPFSLRWGALDFLVAVLVPGAGLAAVTVGLVFETVFRRSSRPRRDPDLFEGAPEDRAPRALLDPVEELRMNTTVEPFAETLAAGDTDGLDLALRRLAGMDTPLALSRLKEALRSPRRDVRQRIRGLVVRIEDRLVRVIRESRDPLERARACRKMARLSTIPETARLHLERAVAEYRQGLAADPGSPAALELAEILILLDDPRRARETLDRLLLRRPEDPAALRLRIEASLRLGDPEAARRDRRTLSEATR